MKFALTSETNLDPKRNEWIHKLSDKIEKQFLDKFYGEDLKELFIGLICVKPQFNEFFKPRKLQYQKGEKTKINHGIAVTIKDCVQYDLKLNYEELSKMDEVNITKTISEVLFDSINCLTEIKKLRDFNFNDFKRDFQKVLADNERSLI